MSPGLLNEVTMTQPLMTRFQVLEFVRDELGIPLSLTTLEKMCMPSVGKGPPVAGMWSRRPLYDREAVRAWALELARAPHRLSRPGPAPAAA